jgi:hypothetical protein
MTALGADFARAVASKDKAQLRALMHPDVDFRGLTPRKFWEAHDPDAVLEVVFGNWFEDTDEIESVDRLDTGGVADREHVTYRFSVRNPEGRFVVEQQAYLTEQDGRIGWMRVLCTGFRPAA